MFEKHVDAVAAGQSSCHSISFIDSTDVIAWREFSLTGIADCLKRYSASVELEAWKPGFHRSFGEGASLAVLWIDYSPLILLIVEERISEITLEAKAHKGDSKNIL